MHIFEGIGPTGVNVDQYCLGRGVTTAIDAGSAGSFAIAGFRQYVIKPSATRVFAMVDIGARGTLMGLAGNYTNLDWVNPQRTARAAEANKPDVVAIKVRLSKPITGPNDMEVSETRAGGGRTFPSAVDGTRRRFLFPAAANSAPIAKRRCADALLSRASPTVRSTPTEK